MNRQPTPAELTAAALMASFPHLPECAPRTRPAGPTRCRRTSCAGPSSSVDEPRLVLRAPRSHGKTTSCSPISPGAAGGTGGTRPAGSTRPPSGTVRGDAVQRHAGAGPRAMARFRDLLLDNPPLFGDLLPEGVSRDGTAQTRWAASEVRLRNRGPPGSAPTARACAACIPTCSVLDDVLNDANSPVRRAARQDAPLLHGHAAADAPGPDRRDRDGHPPGRPAEPSRPGMGTGPTATTPRSGFRADDVPRPRRGDARVPLAGAVSGAELLALRDVDPLTFSREYQNDPRDDAGLPVPVRARPARHRRRGGPDPRHRASGRGGEFVVLGVDIARSAAARADFTVVDGRRLASPRRNAPVLDIRREKGLEFDAPQIELICDLTVRHRREPRQ